METKLKFTRRGYLSRNVVRQIGVLPIETRRPVVDRIPQSINNFSKTARKASLRANSNTSYVSLGSGCSTHRDCETDDELSSPVNPDALSLKVTSSQLNQSKEDRTKSKVPQKCLSSKEILELCQENDYYKVYEIDLHGMSLTEFPDLEKFRKLRVADLSGNNIKKICHINFTQDLRDLKLYDNSITQIEGLENLKELCNLQLQYNQIQAVGKGLTDLKKLQFLRLDSNQLNKLEATELVSCVQIRTLDLSNNHIENIVALTCLSNLEELYVSGNCLQKLADLRRCKRLQELDLSRNRLTDLSGIADLPSLQILDVSENQLTTLSSLGKLKSLEELNVGGNRLSTLSDWGAAFPKLQILNLCSNELQAWGQVCLLANLPELAELHLACNPVTLENGERPTYHTDIQGVLPCLEIIDGVHLKRATGGCGVPLMRPMTASSAVSVRQVEGQMKAALKEQESMERIIEERFASLKALFDSLPAHPPPSTNFPSPSELSSSEAISRCSSRARIREAQAFARSMADVE